jgi:hypothetical protein
MSYIYVYLQSIHIAYHYNFEINHCMMQLQSGYIV